VRLRKNNFGKIPLTPELTRKNQCLRGRSNEGTVAARRTHSAAHSQLLVSGETLRLGLGNAVQLEGHHRSRRLRVALGAGVDRMSTRQSAGRVSESCFFGDGHAPCGVLAEGRAAEVAVGLADKLIEANTPKAAGSTTFAFSALQFLNREKLFGYSFRKECVMLRLVLLVAFVCSSVGYEAQAAEKRQQSKQKPAAFSWVNPAESRTPGLEHATFRSPSMGIDVGFFVYLPEAYRQPIHRAKRFPVVYYLHGGRPGSEKKSISLAAFIHQATTEKTISPTIYVFINGGPVSHYNYPEMENAMGEDVFIHELIPHIDRTYRTIANRSGRAIEGFSQGGRGTMRIVFRHPELFCSAAPGGGGYATEKRISEEGGRESETLRFEEGYNTWDLAKAYAVKKNAGLPAFRMLVYVGTEGFNYENNLEFMEYLDSIGVPFHRLLVSGAPHSAKIIYEKNATDILGFHQQSFQMQLQDDSNTEKRQGLSD